MQETIQRRALLYDKSGEEHYNLISALHKSMRNSDPDAAVYWLARMVEAGEDPLYIARRLVRFASEDVGNADPQALTVAVAAKDAVHFIGMPEGNTALAQAAIYLATAPKSNAVYEAYNQAAEDAHNDVAEPVPLHLRNAPTKLMKDLDYGKGLSLRARRGRRRRRHVVPAAGARGTRRTTSRPSAGSKRRSSGGSTAGRRSRRSDARTTINAETAEHAAGSKRLASGSGLSASGKALPVDQALTIAIQIAGALDRAHRKRDRASLLDFGLAKTTGVAQDFSPAVVGHIDTMAATMTSPITAQGTTLGTFQYMAPEQEPRSRSSRRHSFHPTPQSTSLRATANDFWIAISAISQLPQTNFLTIQNGTTLAGTTMLKWPA